MLLSFPLLGLLPPSTDSSNILRGCQAGWEQNIGSSISPLQVIIKTHIVAVHKSWRSWWSWQAGPPIHSRHSVTSRLSLVSLKPLPASVSLLPPASSLSLRSWRPRGSRSSSGSSGSGQSRLAGQSHLALVAPGQHLGQADHDLLHHGLVTAALSYHHLSLRHPPSGASDQGGTWGPGQSRRSSGTLR